MAISKVVYGTKTLVDLTSDTVDAAHLAKGYTAHDAAGNHIVGTLESQADSNLIRSITPSLLNGATQSGSAYVIPKTDATSKEYIRYALDLPTLASDTTFRLSASGEFVGETSYVIFAGRLYFKKSDGSEGSKKKYFYFDGSSQCADFQLASGVTPVRLTFESYGKYPSISISNVVLNSFAG